ncbi:MAG: Response regulator containing a CheY-like receiver domain and an DNA-binding domain [Frankiales bacterium]|nr:Response regulator containing a CheY-like receiver domain and an DNA-binding domain [Frankiales bacterium]
MTEEPCRDDAGAAGDAQDHLPALVRASALPVWLLDLGNHRVVEVSDAVASLLGGRREQIVQRHVTDFLADQTSARSRLNLLATAQLDSYCVHDVTYRRVDGSELQADAGLTACADDVPRRLAVGVLLPVAKRTPDGLGRTTTPDVVVLGTVDGDWNVDRISGDVERLLGHPAVTVVGRPLSELVQPEDWPSLLVAIGHALHAHGGAITTRLRMRQADGEPRLCRVLVTALAGGVPGLAFSFAPADRLTPSVADRAWELEGHLRRIAREVAASGLLAGLTETPTAATIPAMATLSTRELEIVTGLLAGERVGMIAERMFLSQSTVRNHLTSVYRKLGIRTQQELLRLLRDKTVTTPKRGDFA